MCECQFVADFFVFTDSFTEIFSPESNGQQSYPRFFLEDYPCENVNPNFDYDINYYTCSECLQDWYFECTPVENTYPNFGIKIQDIGLQLSENKINSIKQFLIVLAHEGFSKSKCAYSECVNYALQDRKICVNHFEPKFLFNHSI